MSFKVHLENGGDIEFDERLDERIVEALRSLDELPKKKYKPNQQRVRDFSAAYLVLQKVFGQTCKVGIKKGEISRDGYFITINGKSICMTSPSDLVNNVLRTADNFEISTNPNGTIDMSVGFYGMVEKVGESS